MKVNICVAQINYRPDDTAGHIERLKSIIHKNRASDLIVFPELILHGHPSLEKPEGLLYRKIKQYYMTMHDRSSDLFQYIKDMDARVILGELKGRPGTYYNAATYIDKDSTVSYLKTHVHWTEKFVPGSKIEVFNSPFGKVGINICFDAAFPEIWRIAALKGAQVIVNISAVPGAFPVEYMWLRMKAAALNNQVFVVYANRPGDFFAGHSAVFDPKGEVVVSARSGEKILNAEIDLDEVKAWRREERIYSNRRPVLYREISRHQIKKSVKKRKGVKV